MPEIGKTVTPRSRAAWREWLRKNHKKEKEIFLIHHKRHTGKPFLSHRETLEEAICFGWIDTTVKRLDEDRFGRFFRKRTKNSRWSHSTLGYARQLIREKKMTPAGMAAFRDGLKKEVIDLAVPKNLEMPEDLKKALAKNKKANKNFDAFAPSYKKSFIYWVHRAVREETRKKRIREVVNRAAANKRLGIA